MFKKIEGEKKQKESEKSITQRYEKNKWEKTGPEKKKKASKKNNHVLIE